jgi:DNA polymerase-3 subunit alpha
VKFDFLGLKTCPCFKRPCRCSRSAASTVDLDRSPGTTSGLQAPPAGETVGVFQLESEGMRRTLAAVKPTSFEDIIALVSLYRPGPMD